MKNSISVFFIIILLQSCKNELKKDSETLSIKGPQYKTYNYSGFTKEEKYAFHKHFTKVAIGPHMGI